MTTTLTNREMALVDNYYEVIQLLSDPAKLALTQRLSDSLRKKESERELTRRMIDKFAGAWEDDGRSVDEIMATIRESYTVLEPLTLNLIDRNGTEVPA